MPTISAAEGTPGSSSTDVDFVDNEKSSQDFGLDSCTTLHQDQRKSDFTLTGEEEVSNLPMENPKFSGGGLSDIINPVDDDDGAGERCVPSAEWVKISPSRIVGVEGLKDSTNAIDRQLEGEVFHSLEDTSVKDDDDRKVSKSENSVVEDEDEGCYDNPIDEDDEYDWVDVVGSGDILKKTLCPGTEKCRPDRGQLLTLNLKGYLDNNALVEDLQNFSFNLGDAEVVQGLELALPLMDVKEIAQIMVNSRFAYGALGRDPDIPPDATITYTVELVDAVDEQEIETLPISKRMEIGSSKKDRGNFWFARGDFSQAVVCYRRSLDYLDDENHVFSDPAESLQKMLEDRLKVYNNLALAQLKLEAYDAAMKSVDHVLRVQPQNVKALFRKGKIFAAQGSIDEAIMYMKRAGKLEPETKAIHLELARLSTKKTHENLSERELYRKMLGEQRQKNKKREKSRLRIWGSLLGGMAAVVVGIFAYRQYHGWS